MQSSSGDGSQLTQAECDAVAAAVIAQYNSLPRNGKPAQGEWTVLAGFAAVRGPPSSPLVHVLSCCTGTKCIGRSRLQGCGSLLHDSHAEVIARRNMLLSVVKEFARLVADGPRASSTGLVLEWPLEEARPRVITGTRLCLYVSQSPCGDASIYDVSEDVQQLLPSKRQRVELRLSATHDCGGGDHVLHGAGAGSGSPPVTAPSILQLTGARAVASERGGEAAAQDSAPSRVQDVGVMRTKPGRGAPTHCMSCSDKILRWCCEGLQGAAADCLFRLQLSCIVIGDQFNAAACNRAFTSRCAALGAAAPQVAPTRVAFPCSRYQIEKAAAAASIAAGGDNSAAADAAAAAAARAAPLSVHWRAGAGTASEVSIANGIRHGTTLRARVGGSDCSGRDDSSSSSSTALVSVCKRLMFFHTSRAVAAAASAGILPPSCAALWGLPPDAPPPSKWAAGITWAQAKAACEKQRWKDRVGTLSEGRWVGAPGEVDGFCLGTALLSLPLKS
jgi:tRNA-specific adenosine deaminase 1